MTNIAPRHPLKDATDKGIPPLLRSALRRNWRGLFILLSLLIDLLSILFAALGAAALRSFFPNVAHFSEWTLAVFGLYFSGVLIGFALLNGLYRGAFHLSNRKQYLLASRAYVISLFVVLSTFYVIQSGDFPRRFTFLFFVLLPIFFAFGRTLLNMLNKFLQKRGFGVHKVMMAGYDGEIDDLLRRFKEVPELGYDIRAIVHHKPSARPASRTGSKKPAVYTLKEIGKAVEEQRIDRILVPSPEILANGLLPVLEVCRSRGIKLKVLSREQDVLLNLARVYDIAGITLYAPPRFRVEAFRRVAKRLFDIVGSIILISLLSPVFLTTACGIAIESGFPFLFKQKRASIKKGKTFGFIKFRSMVRNADELKADLMKFNESDGALFKMKNDPRVTRVGKFIRKYSIDELPQLFNVLKGDMSLVGPRPLPVKDFEMIKESVEFWESIRDRAKVKPGMTGLWQISGRSKLGFREMVLLDLYYVENHSILFDLEILFGTIPVVLFGKGAY